MTRCHRGCVSRMRLVQVAILLLISSAFIFTTGTMSTVQTGAESCAGNNARDKNVVVAAQVIPTGGSIQSHNGKYHCPERFLGKSVEISMFPSPTSCMLSFSFFLIKLRYNLQNPLK